MKQNILKDPRYFQIAALTLILSYGIALVGLEFNAWRSLATVLTCLGTQWLATSATGSRFDPLSAIITSLSLTLLLRTDSIELAIIAGVVAIGSKFLIRIRGKHLFNPANIALVLLMLLTDRVWVSSGQWGTDTLVGIGLAALGMLVLNRVRIFTTSVAFLTTFALAVILRALYLGDPLAIPLHQLQNGALLIFTFFMISDPRTTPNATLARIIFGVVVALVAFTIEFAFYTPAGPIWALATCMPLVPLLDYLLPRSRFVWRAASTPHPESQKLGVTHAI